MGTLALIVFLGSLGAGAFCLILVVYSAMRIYRTLRYAYKDSRPWTALFKEYSRAFSETAKVMEGRVQDISRSGREIRETMEDMRDTVEELRSHSLLRVARFAARRRG